MLVTRIIRAVTYWTNLDSPSVKLAPEDIPTLSEAFCFKHMFVLCPVEKKLVIILVELLLNKMSIPNEALQKVCTMSIRLTSCLTNSLVARSRN
jgi:hypothetical protein